MNNIDDCVSSGCCTGCSACISSCPFGELEMADCGICLLHCPASGLGEEDEDD
ncbi:ferredoxin [Anaerotaenia torta]|uniref:hypothetical protein n=1 Tax=Anaerotaenia torta TaxID=433293 RepID=UPI003D2453C0